MPISRVRVEKFLLGAAFAFLGVIALLFWGLLGLAIYHDFGAVGLIVPALIIGVPAVGGRAAVKGYWL